MGAIVTDLDGKVLYQRDSDRRLVPASNEKLISNAFALYTLGPTFKPVTRFWKTADGVVVDAPGDPLLTDAQLELVAAKLGSDNPSVKVREAYHPYYPSSWEFDDLPNRYAAPVCSFAFNQGGFEMWAIDGKPVLLPRSFGVQVSTQPAPGKVRIDFDPMNEKAVVFGTLPGEKTKLERFAIPHPDRAAASYFGSGFELTQDVPKTIADATLFGKPISDVLPSCLKSSDNLIAENLLMMSVTKGRYLDDPYKTAREQETDFLTKVVGVDSGDFNLMDGSGLSRHNLVTARMLARLLRWADRQPTRALWRSALVDPGAGTLHKRLTGMQFEGKTGTLDMVVALSGYVHARNGKTLIVSVIVNGFAGSTEGIRGIVDRFVRKVAEQE